MRNVLLSVFTAGLLSVSAVAGVYAQSSTTLGEVQSLEASVLTVCLGDEATYRASLAAYSSAMANLVASGQLTNEQAVERFQILRDALRAAGCSAATDDIFEELFPDTASIVSGSGVNAGTGDTTGGGGPRTGEPTGSSVSPS